MNAKRILQAIALAAAVLASTSAAQAADGVWKVGSGFVVRYESLDLEAAQGRAELLGMIETAASRLCRDEATRARRETCFADAVAQATAAADGRAQVALSQARIERGELQMAAR
jgi:UrcA family protein